MIKTISFDLGGVLFSEGKTVAMDRLAKEFAYNPKLILDILSSSQSILLRKGLISGTEFWNWAQEQLPKEYDVTAIKTIWYDSYILDEKIFDLLKRLKSKYSVVVFSGNIQDRIEYLDAKYGFRKYFDKEIYSFNYHFDKEEQDAINHLLVVTQNSVEEIVHIDDVKSVVNKFISLGLKSVIYNGDIEFLERELQTLGVA